MRALNAPLRLTFGMLDSISAIPSAQIHRTHPTTKDIESNTPERYGKENYKHLNIKVMKEKKIYSIEKGYGQGASYYRIGNSEKHSWYVDEIKEEIKPIGKGYHNDITITVFRGYRKGELIFEIEANSSLTISYSQSDSL